MNIFCFNMRIDSKERYQSYFKDNSPKIGLIYKKYGHGWPFFLKGKRSNKSKQIKSRTSLYNVAILQTLNQYYTDNSNNQTTREFLKCCLLAIRYAKITFVDNYYNRKKKHLPHYLVECVCNLNKPLLERQFIESFIIAPIA